jgi:hypothetical protein
LDDRDDGSGLEDSSCDLLTCGVLQGCQVAPGVVNVLADTAETGPVPQRPTATAYKPDLEALCTSRRCSEVSMLLNDGTALMWKNMFTTWIGIYLPAGQQCEWSSIARSGCCLLAHLSCQSMGSALCAHLPVQCSQCTAHSQRAVNRPMCRLCKGSVEYTGHHTQVGSESDGNAFGGDSWHHVAGLADLRAGPLISPPSVPQQRLWQARCCRARYPCIHSLIWNLPRLWPWLGQMALSRACRKTISSAGRRQPASKTNRY